MNRKILLGLLTPCLSVVALLAPQQALAQAQKNPWANSAEIRWANADTLGPGTSTKMLLTKENGFLDDVLRAEFLLKIDPGGSYATNDSPKEDLAFYVTAGQARFTLADQQIDAKPGDAFGVPAGTKHGIVNNGKDPFEVVVFAAPLMTPNPTAKPVWGRADDMKWEPNATHGPGCDLKMILRGGFSNVIRGLWIIRVNGSGINIVHSGAEHQMFYIFEAPEPSKTPRDSRTEASRIIVGNTVLQARVGDTFYAGGAPKLVEHGMFNESKDKPMTYVAIGARIPGQPEPGRKAGKKQASEAPINPAAQPGK